ncbi:hypothetical protein DXO170_15410 [Xanthomonas oryzae pv. oryzae]|uniref:Uncharacterized protein n=1 Tax=Xanthomonas oryzae pv. oryzae TaxID=64187 RepID=A0A854CIN5_XANOO|nr:hypothetical protein ABM06_22230 [Xanthomonas oryzae pv. oryzae]OLG35692.1 hypothetical protein BXO2_10005 [Xanthomonas oryzae pv. oryzae]OLG38387.1 hypothetical protein BXO6_01205 [Xanthomonas oryzae pv. oryzae]OLG43070.1 hypothetical protein BXO25_16615 [Xanthomonas oryzae pv. oryzae]OLG44947.1 hypothetical protein BXO33_10615 [Xanthomonas oryzae pv. oryzae]
MHSTPASAQYAETILRWVRGVQPSPRALAAQGVCIHRLEVCAVLACTPSRRFTRFDYFLTLPRCTLPACSRK